MEYNFVEIKSNLPAKVERSNRLNKKMKIGIYAKTLFAWSFDGSIFELDTCDELLDVIYEFDNGVFVFGGDGKTTIYTESWSSIDITEFIINYSSGMLKKLNEVDSSIDVKVVDIQYGDSTYGEW